MVEFRPELGFRAEQGREFYNSDQIIELIVAKPVILASAVLELVRTAVQLDTTIICLFVAIQSNLHPKPRCFVSRTWQKQVPALWASADQCCPVSPQAQSDVLSGAMRLNASAAKFAKPDQGTFTAGIGAVGNGSKGAR